jgi:hypothetical protein
VGTGAQLSLEEPFQRSAFDDAFVEAHEFAVLRLNKKSFVNQGFGHTGVHLGGLRLNK